MKYALAALVTVLLSTAVLSAQSATWPRQPLSGFGVAGMEGMGASSSGLAKIGQAPINACPVSMRIQHRSDGNLVRTQSAHPKGAGQRLHITLAGLDSKQIVKATLTVYGLSAKGQDTSSEMTQTATVPFAASANGGFSADFWVPGMTAVQLIDLKSIQYSDGSTWKLADGQTCQARPDLFMLVSSR
jgi:hypothetical protein